MILYLITGFFLFLLIGGIQHFFPIGLWLSALASGVWVSPVQLALMRIRKVPQALIVNALVRATKAGLHLSCDELETHHLAGGNVNTVVNALIAAHKANMDLDFKTATAIDLAKSRRTT